MPPHKSIRYVLSTVLVLCVLILGLLAVLWKQLPAIAETADDFHSELRVISDVFHLIRKYYVEETPPQKLLAGALNGMLTSLDPYSQFLSREAYEDLTEDTHGEFGGIGVEVTLRGGLLHVVAPLDGSPAEQAGVRAGDTIVKIDDVPTREMTLNDAAKRMRGKPGSPIKLTLMHEQESRWSEMVIIRREIKIKSVREAKLLEDGAGYIRLSAFQEKSAIDLGEAIRSLQARGMRGLVLDIRNNAGGLLTSAVEVSELFIPEGRLIVSTKGRSRQKNRDYFSKGKDVLTIKPLVILVNKGSASSSEIFAGAIQDYRLGTLVGTKTFGKGSIQSLIPLGDGTAVRMTTSRYYTPAGRVIHEQGIVPDIVAEPGDDKGGKDLVLLRALEFVEQERAGTLAQK